MKNKIHRKIPKEEKMKEYQKESNIIIAINTLRKIIEIFSGPFLTTYFIKTSSESMLDISIYNMFSYIILAITSFMVGYIMKNKLKMAMFRIGVITNFIYILLIIILKEKVVQYLGVLAVLYGLSSSLYFMPFNLFLGNKIKNEDRTGYEVKKEVISSVINIVIPIILGSIITVTNYILTAVIILIISFMQIIFSFILKPLEEPGGKFNMREMLETVKKNKDIKRMMLVEYLTGLSVNNSALATLATILIYNAFTTDFNLGMVTSISYILQLIVLYVYGKRYRKKSDKHIIIGTCFIPFITLMMFLMYPNNVTIVIYNLCYTIFVSLLGTIRTIRLYNISNSGMIDRTNQEEFWSVREVCLNLGRTTGYMILFFVGITADTSLLNIIMIIFTMFILVLGASLSKIDKNKYEIKTQIGGM